MLTETLTALAAAGGTAVVGAAGTSLWEGIRSGTARLFGRGDADRERLELVELDRTAAALEAAGPEAVVAVRAEQLTAWRTRLVTLLQAASEEERDQLAKDLLALIENHGTPAAREEATVILQNNDFRGPTALIAGNHNTQHITFGTSGT
ncbi:hypothetical protein ACIRBX_36660 [Kitasatospora sp. NPDC096147]|uniref:hypothetical protein n=1 Tax=Kitasatospora sp. NPDC096147 TaxID=3364093 RepID=UPI00380F3ACF